MQLIKASWEVSLRCFEWNSWCPASDHPLALSENADCNWQKQRRTKQIVGASLPSGHEIFRFLGEIPWISGISGFLVLDFVMVYLTIYHPDGFEIPCACMPFSQVKALWNNEREDTSSWHDSTGIPVPYHWWPPSSMRAWATASFFYVRY